MLFARHLSVYRVSALNRASFRSIDSVAAFLNAKVLILLFIIAFFTLNSQTQGMQALPTFAFRQTRLNPRPTNLFGGLIIARAPALTVRNQRWHDLGISSEHKVHPCSYSWYLRVPLIFGLFSSFHSSRSGTSACRYKQIFQVLMSGSVHRRYTTYQSRSKMPEYTIIPIINNSTFNCPNCHNEKVFQSGTYGRS